MINKKIEITQALLDLFESRQWNNQENKNLLELIKDKRLKMAPCTLKNLDSIGFNHLEIIELDSCIGKVIHKLTTSQVDFLNIMQEKLGIVFNHEDKIKNKRNIKLNSFCFNYDKEMQCFYGISGLFLQS
jgi:hypothetical protein